ncbi:MAG TPA: HEAT repeat domain-containing protein [Candidatus Rifleibacterium sp.]|nr:HEAT repeat domain-containing protein [Candidatus Rifleibacterium sp.]HPT46339.1 HEAT repeat domain-containing protein [Candidatus Rifleibacterium sp.]
MSQEAHNISLRLESSVAKERQQGIVLAARGNLVAMIPRITAIAGSDPDQETRYFARKALEHLQQIAQPSEPEPDKFSAVDIEKLFNSEDPHARFAGLKKVLVEKTPTGRFLLLDALSREPIVQIRASLIIGVGHFRNPEDIKVIAPFLKNEDARVRSNTVEALALIGGEEALRHVVSVMSDDDNRVKANVLKALQGVGGPSLFNLLKAMAVDERPWARASAVFAFTRIKSPQSLVALATIAQSDNDPGIRARALHAIRVEKDAGNPAAAVILDKLEAVQALPQVAAAPLVVEPIDGMELHEFLASPETANRYLALTHFNQNNLAEFQEHFIKAFETEEDYFLLALMLNLVRDLNIAPCFNRVRVLLNHQDERIRANAIEALAVIDMARACDYLVPMLEDKNSRVVGNAVLALRKTSKIDLIVELKKMLSRGRESFKHSVVYILQQVKEPLAVGIIEKLIRDPNPRLRDKAFAALQSYATQKIPGAAALLRDVEKQIVLDRNRDSFFENSLDVAFAGVINLIKAKTKGDEAPVEKVVFERTPQSERAALLSLASHCHELKLVDSRTIESLDLLDRELKTVEKLILQATSSGETAIKGIEEATKRVSEEQLLILEKNSLIARREAVLAAFAFDYFNNRSALDSKTLSLLRSDFGRVEGSLCSVVPQQAFTMLPGKDAAVSEIFDVTMRLYQKHVYLFSKTTMVLFMKWALGFIILSGVGGFFMALFPPVAFMFLVGFVPYYAYKSLGMLVEWKILMALMVEDYIHGREVDKEHLTDKVATLFKPVFDNSIKKHLLLSLWLMIALFCGGVIFLAAGILGRDGIIFSLGTLAAVVVGMLIMASVYFKYLLVEPASILLPGKDPFVISEKYFMNDRLRLASLFIFATFIMMIITGTSTEIMTFFMPVLPAIIAIIVIQVLSFVSEICLAPIVFSNIVIYCLMNIRQGEKP